MIYGLLFLLRLLIDYKCWYMKIDETYLNIILKDPMKIMLMFLQETSTLSNEFLESNEIADFNVNEHIPSL